MTVEVTPAQARILDELCRDGADDQRIADRLRLSRDTVKCQLYRVRLATRSPDRTALAVAILRGALVLQVADRRYRPAD